MSFIDRVRDALLPGISAPAHSLALASPWAGSSHLAKIAIPEVIGHAPHVAMSREQASRVPALQRARGLIVTTIARLPIVAVDSEDNAQPGSLPAWVTNTAGPVSPFHRMLWTCDDLFFYGWSLWAVERDNAGAVTAAERVPYERWSTAQDGTVLIDDAPAPADNVILIPGVTEGILTHGIDALTQAVKLAAAASRAADNPSAQVELHQTNDAPMTDEEIDKLIARWSAARRGAHGGVAYTSSAIEVKEHGASSEHLLMEGRNAAAVDIARHAGIPATMIDATLSGSSLSYQNTAARMSELVTFGLSPIMAAITARLSLDDVTPPGVHLQFDTGGMLKRLADLSGTTEQDTDLDRLEPIDSKELPR